MTKICGNCFWFSVLPSCIKLHKPGSPACDQWSPDAKVILWQREQEKLSQQTIKAMVVYLSEKCSRCPAYRKNANCLIDDCESYLMEYFTGMAPKRI